MPPVLDWKEAAPLIGVILAAFLGLIGTLVASRRRTEGLAATPAGVPAAVAGALAERGLAEGLTIAIGALTAVIMKACEAAEKDRDEDTDLRRKQHDAMMEELRKLRIQMEMKR